MFSAPVSHKLALHPTPVAGEAHERFSFCLFMYPEFRLHGFSNLSWRHESVAVGEEDSIFPARG